MGDNTLIIVIVVVVAVGAFFLMRERNNSRGGHNPGGHHDPREHYLGGLFTDASDIFIDGLPPVGMKRRPERYPVPQRSYYD